MGGVVALRGLKGVGGCEVGVWVWWGGCGVGWRVVMWEQDVCVRVSFGACGMTTGRSKGGLARIVSTMRLFMLLLVTILCV
jgi:hypothetical protein